MESRESSSLSMHKYTSISAPPRCPIAQCADSPTIGVELTQLKIMRQEPVVENSKSTDAYASLDIACTAACQLRTVKLRKDHVNALAVRQS